MDVLSAIKSFPNGYAGGPNLLHPQHQKNMLNDLQDPDDSPMLSALAGFCSLVLQGGDPGRCQASFLWCLIGCTL